MAWTDLVNATTADADQVENNFRHIGEGSRLPMGGTNMANTNGVYDLGSSTFRWNNAYVNTFPATTTFSSDLLVTGLIRHIPKIAVFQERYGTQTSGQTANTVSAWFKKFFNTSTVNSITGCTISSSVITIPPGTYEAEWHTSFGNLAAGDNHVSGFTRLHDTANSVTLAFGFPFQRAAITAGVLDTHVAFGKSAQPFVISSTITAELQYFHNMPATAGVIYHGNISGYGGSNLEFVYTSLRLTRIY